MRLSWLAACLALTVACGSMRIQPITDSRAQPLVSPVDLLVFAPHPDDEVIGAAGLVRRAVESGKRVLIVFVTNGDAYANAASALVHRSVDELRAGDYLVLAAARQREAIDADRILGVNPRDLIFLGYPDGGLAELYA